MLVSAMLLALIASVCGLMASFYLSLPAGPAVVLSAAILFFISILFGPCGGIIRMQRFFRVKEKA